MTAAHARFNSKQESKNLKCGWVFRCVAEKRTLINFLIHHKFILRLPLNLVLCNIMQNRGQFVVGISSILLEIELQFIWSLT